MHYASTVKVLRSEPDKNVRGRDINEDGVDLVIEVSSVSLPAFSEVEGNDPAAVPRLPSRVLDLDPQEPLAIIEYDVIAAVPRGPAGNPVLLDSPLKNTK